MQSLTNTENIHHICILYRYYIYYLPVYKYITENIHHIYIYVIYILVRYLLIFNFLRRCYHAWLYFTRPKGEFPPAHIRSGVPFTVLQLTLWNVPVQYCMEMYIQINEKLFHARAKWNRIFLPIPPLHFPAVLRIAHPMSICWSMQEEVKFEHLSTPTTIMIILHPMQRARKHTNARTHSGCASRTRCMRTCM